MAWLPAGASVGASATRKRTIRFFRSYSGTPHFRHSRGCSRERPAWSGRGRARDDLQRRGPRRWSGRRGAPPARLLPRLSRPRCWSRCPLAPQSMIQRKLRAIRIQRRFSVYRQRPVDFFSDSPNRARPASSKKTVTGLLSHERTTEQGTARPSLGAHPQFHHLPRSRNPRPSKIAGIALSIRAVRVPDCFALAK